VKYALVMKNVQDKFSDKRFCQRKC